MTKAAKAIRIIIDRTHVESGGSYTATESTEEHELREISIFEHTESVMSTDMADSEVRRDEADSEPLTARMRTGSESESRRDAGTRISSESNTSTRSELTESRHDDRAVTAESEAVS